MARQISRGPGRESIGWYGEQFLLGKPQARRDLVHAFRSDVTESFTIPHPKDKHRADNPGENVTHEDFEIPEVWGEPAYRLFRAKVAPGDPPTWRSSHSGEEVLFAYKNGVDYDFYWPRAQSKQESCIGTVLEGQAIRILPNVPHRNRCIGDEATTVWMVIRHLSGSTVPIESRNPVRKSGETADGDGEVDQQSGHPESSDGLGKITSKQLEDPTRAILLLSDIPGRLQLARTRSGYSITDLAKRVNLHPSYLWRLERGATNLSIKTLELIAEEVRLDLSDLGIPSHFPDPAFRPDRMVPSELDKYLPYSIMPPTQNQNQHSGMGGVYHRSVLNYFPCYEHWVHLRIYEMEKGAQIRLASGLKPDQELPYLDSTLGPWGKQSWIVLEGEVGFDGYHELTGTLASTSHWPHQQPVIHLRNHANATIRAASACKLLHVEFSAMCSCAGPKIRLAADNYQGSKQDG